MNLRPPMLFALSESHDLGARISGYLGIELQKHLERDFEDGEHKISPGTSVRDRDIFVIQSLYGDTRHSTHDKLIRLLFFIGALRDASARTVTAVVPFLCYARKDMKTKPRDPVNTRYVAQLLEAVGTDRVVTMDVHNLAAFQNAFRCRTDHLEARKLFVRHFAPLLEGHQVTVISPDTGGIKRAEKFRQDLSLVLDREASSGFMEKHRSGGVVTGETLVGDVAGKVVIIIDDLISTGGTMLRTARACCRAGAAKVHAAATHGMFTGEADKVFADPAISGLVVVDTVPPFRITSAAVREKLIVLDGAALVAEAIGRIHAGGSVVDLLSA
jgi:ribose-phosphate pyrophosphokinase